jgi:aryl-alcohol dehydrogenase-like predicted oxidoreductase
MNRTEVTRRTFLETSASIAGATLLTGCVLPQNSRRSTATDQVTLGKTNIKLSRLGMGTGSNSGKVQRDLGREGFISLVRHAYDRGITYIDTAQNYNTHELVRDAIKGLPREKMFLLTKMPGVPDKPLEVLDRYRKELGTDYLDVVLTHCAIRDNWPDERRRVLDALEEAKQRKIIGAHGVSCHGLPALKTATRTNWVDVHLVRLNPQGRHVDARIDKWKPFQNEDTVPDVASEIQAMRAQGRGIIGMKIIGNGEFTSPEDREKSVRYAVRSGLLDAMVIGFASPAEIDEAIERINRAFAEV